MTRFRQHRLVPELLEVIKKNIGTAATGSDHNEGVDFALCLANHARTTSNGLKSESQ
jgi:hypothetical protein